MKAREFVLIVVRLFGLWVLFTCINSAEQTLAGMLPMPDSTPEITRFVTIFNLFDFLLHAAIGALITWKPEIIADRMPLDVQKDSEINVNTEDLMFTCFSVAGLVFLVVGLSGLVYHVSFWLFNPTKPPYEFHADWASITSSAFKAAMGLLLAAKFRGIVKGLRWLNEKGRTFGVVNEVEER